jgi:hypothetical protein
LQGAYWVLDKESARYAVDNEAYDDFGKKIIHKCMVVAYLIVE